MTDREKLIHAGEVLLGVEWRRPLAALLGPHHPQGARPSIDPRLPARWAAGEREVPGWVVPALRRIVQERAADLHQLAKDLEA